MIFRFVIYCFIIIVCTTVFACAHSSGVLTSKEFIRDGNKIVAWNEDTILPWKFLITNSDRFIYSITFVNDNGLKIQKFYTGKANYIENIIMLTYKKGKMPENTVNYLLKEFSGNYLIQTMQNDSNRVFLRITYPLIAR